MRMWRWWSVFLLLILAPVAYLFHPDGVVTPLLRAKGFRNFVILMVSGTLGTIEMLLWYLGWGGIRRQIAEWFREDVNFAKKVAGKIKREGYVDWVKIHFTRKYKILDEKATKLVKGLKVGSYLGFFLLGCWPTPGPRMVGDFICGTTGWKGGLIVLCIGNFIKTFYLVFAWDKVFSFFGW